MFKGIEGSLSLLSKSKGVCILHEVDATNLSKSKELIEGKDDRIIWNFPCVDTAQGQDGQNQQMEENKELLRNFFLSSKSYLSLVGEVHILHKTKTAFTQWDIGVQAMTNGFFCVGKVIFDREIYPGYIPKKAQENKSFPVWDSVTFIYTAQEARNNSLEKNKGTLPVSDDTSQVINALHSLSLSDIDLKNYNWSGINLNLLRVTPELLKNVHLFLQAMAKNTKKQSNTLCNKKYKSSSISEHHYENSQ